MEKMKTLLIISAAPGDCWVDGPIHHQYSQRAMPMAAAARVPEYEIKIILNLFKKMGTHK